MVLEVRNMALLSRRTVLSFVCRSPFHIPASRVPARKWCTVALAQPVSLAPAEVAVGADNSASGSNTAALLEKFRSRQIKDAARAAGRIPVVKEKPVAEPPAPLPETFGELGLTDELLVALDHLKIEKPTEVQRIGIPAVLAGENVVVASHTGSGKTLAYMLPIVQALRTEEALHGFATRPKRPRAVVLCPTRELAEQVYKVAKSICHHARFRAAIIGGGSRMKPQEDTLNSPVDMVVGTPGRLLMHIEEGNMVYGDIKYVILDEADTMFDQGFAPEVRKFLRPLRNRASKPGGKGFQTVLVTATITKAVQKLLDEEFPGIKRLYTSTLHKKVATARHEFIKISGSENKLDSLLQVLEPSVSKGNRVMVFCNTVSSCRAVDHHLRESGMTTVNYHGEVPAEERVENLNKFRAENQTRVPPLICTDLAARGLDLVVDQVIMFDFPLNSIDYLHRTGRTARMGAKGKVTSLFTKHSQTLAEQIQLAMSKGESLEGVIGSREKLEVIKKLEARTKKEKEGRKGDKAGTRRGTKVGLVRSPSGALKVARGSSAKSVERKVGNRSSDPKRSGTDTKRPSRPLSKSRPSQAVGSFKSKPGPSGGRGRKPAAVKKR